LSSVLSDIRRSRVKVRLAEAALTIECSKFQEVKEQVRNDAADCTERISAKLWKTYDERGKLKERLKNRPLGP